MTDADLGIIAGGRLIGLVLSIRRNRNCMSKLHVAKEIWRSFMTSMTSEYLLLEGL